MPGQSKLPDPEYSRLQNFLRALVPIFNQVQVKPKGGCKYIYQLSSDPKKEQDWDADGYKWRCNKTQSRVVDAENEVEYERRYFKLRIATGNGASSFTTEFKRIVIIHPLRPKQVYIEYEGDESSVVEFAHGNAKKNRKALQEFQPNQAVHHSGFSLING